METHTPHTAGAAPHEVPGAQAAFGRARNSVLLYGALSGAVLVAVAVAAGGGHPVNTFMWVRAVLLPVVAVLVHRLTVSASRGSRRAFERLGALAVVMPVAIIGVDAVPGVCPPWYAVAQTVCVLPVVRVAFLTRGSALRAAFPKRP
ncbi:hypothetical protein [Streptomyces sp. NRRL F-5053]|uniref:hypothetical protein n=1 Tax=Streptomyces sp. NRRL F-5053 TaxID=1463854 RepID=UPI0004CB25F2|nr:hypothetical protein [Streptomyces sp. NRRL F-5053]